MVEVKDITGMIEGALAQIINAKVEEEKAKMSVQEVLENVFENHFNEFEEFLKSKEYVRAENKTELTDDEKTEIAHDWISVNSDEALSEALEQGADVEEIVSDWISDNPNEALGEALEKGADVEDVVDDWFSNADLYDILDKASDHYDYKEIGKECFDNL